ncbi:hypothetical protein [Streptomyces sp. 11-1-2]|uniref:hypothetical protein n=1 Tax=unclassified Streptomyces TaxID=2593676 RepID=UPI00268068FB
MRTSAPIRRPPRSVTVTSRSGRPVMSTSVGVARTIKLDTTYLGVGTGMTGEPCAACKADTELRREDFTLTWQKMLAHRVAAIGTTIRVELDIQVVRGTDGQPARGQVRPRSVATGSTALSLRAGRDGDDAVMASPSPQLAPHSSGCRSIKACP